MSTQHTLTAPSAGFALTIALMLTSCGSTSHDAGAPANGLEQATAAAPTAPAQGASNGTADAGDFAARTGQLSNPDNATMVPSYLTYYHFFTTQRVGYAAAIAVVQTILTVGLAVIFLRVQARQQATE